jgi:serine/threonine protein kinase
MPGEPAEPHVLPAGTPLAHYLLGDVLGSGAMGTVYRAHDRGLDRGVALKVLKPGIADDPRAVERFFREARAAARVTHPNLAHVYFVGSEAGRSFFAMEHVEGLDLEEHVKRHGPLPLADAVDAIVQAARGLAAAHGAGVVHRDVKPSNLIRRPDGTVKVTDFGLARSVEGDSEASAAGQVIGTPTYMSPEQVRGEGADVRSDVYMLGLTAFFLLAGRPPFPGPTLGKVLSDQVSAPLPSVLPGRPDLAPAVDDALARLTSKDPARRPADMPEVIGLLETLRPRRVARAPYAARASAYAIDLLMVATVTGAILFLIAMLTRADPTQRVSLLVQYPLWIASQLGMELWWGASVGKMLMRLVVVRVDGLTPAPRTLVTRFLIRSPEVAVGVALVIEPLRWEIDDLARVAAILLGSLCWPLARRRTLSDLATKTTVAYTPQ